MIHVRREGALHGRQVALHLAAVFVLCGSAGSTPGRVQEPEAVRQVDGATLRIVEHILTPAASAAAPNSSKMASAITALGRPGLEVVVAMLAGEVEITAYVQDSMEDPVHPLALAQREAILREALAGFDRSLVLEHLARRLEGEPETGLRLMVVRELGRIDDARAFELLLDGVDGFDPVHLQPSYVHGAIETAIAAHLRFSPSRIAALADRMNSQREPLLPVYARAIGTLHSVDGIELLVEWIGRGAESDCVLLDQVGRVAGDGGLAISGGALQVLRGQLRSEHLNAARNAVVALGRLRDEEAFEDLVGLLESGPPLLASSAQWSLVRICGNDLGSEPQAWQDWRQLAQEQWKERAPALIDALHSEEQGVVLQAVGDLMRHPLYRHQVAEALGPLVVHSDPLIGRGVCLAIARLESRRAVPWLIDALMKTDPELRRLAGEGLRQLTGLELPADYLAWTRVLAG